MEIYIDKSDAGLPLKQKKIFHCGETLQRPIGQFKD